MLVGVIKPMRSVRYCVAQLLGEIAASGIVLALTLGPLSVNTFLQQNTNAAQGVSIETFITTALVLAMLAVEKHQATPFAPIGIGLTLFVSHPANSIAQFQRPKKRSDSSLKPLRKLTIHTLNPLDFTPNPLYFLSFVFFHVMCNV